MTNREKLIQARAYALWEAEGCPHGREELHWRQATIEVDEAGEDSASTSVPMSPDADTPATEAPVAAATPGPVVKRARKASAAAPAPKPRARTKAKA